MLMISSSCCSYIGYVGCRQGISLSNYCFSKGTVAHELGHVIGLFHEQSRPDRDNYVRIITQNIIPAYGKHNLIIIIICGILF